MRAGSVGSVGLRELAQKEFGAIAPGLPARCNPLKFGERAFDAAKQNECNVDLKQQSRATQVRVTESLAKPNPDAESGVP